MSPYPHATTARRRLETLSQVDWLGYRHALLQSLYALLLALVMLLPANFVAYALSTTLYHGAALAGWQYATEHHLRGYWMGGDGVATPVGAIMWWVAALWECLFWASCASAVMVFTFWSIRLVTDHISRRWRAYLPLHRSRPARAA